MIDFINAHWFPLVSQGNIYSLTTLYPSKGLNKILVASLKRKIYSFEYHQHSKWRLKPLLKELVFTYIPSGAEIIAVDAYNKSEENDEFVIGITILKTSGDSIERYLNIYTEGVGEGEENNSIEAIAQNCLMVELSYSPYLLYHTIFPQPTGNEIVWLMSGSDNKIHVIREDKQNNNYTEFPVDKCFPEFNNLKSIALWIDVYYYDEFKRRISGVACECGLFKLAKVDTETLDIISSWTLRYDSPVCSVKIFPNVNTIEKPKFLSVDYDCAKEQEVNVLLTTGNNAIVFGDILKHDLKLDVTLGDNNLITDCILCSCIADVNMDGKNEILLGTYKQEVLIFSYQNNEWKMIDKKLFDAPIHSICYIDLVGDGVKMLVILSQKSVHIMQHDPKEVTKRWKDRLSKLLLMNMIS